MSDEPKIEKDEEQAEQIDIVQDEAVAEPEPIKKSFFHKIPPRVNSLFPPERYHFLKICLMLVLSSFAHFLQPTGQSSDWQRRKMLQVHYQQ